MPRAAALVLLLGGWLAVALAPSFTRAEEGAAKADIGQAEVPSKPTLPQRDTNQLREQLLQVPEVGWTKLDAKTFAELSGQLKKEREALARAVELKVKLPKRLLEPVNGQRKQWEASGLTILGEADCQIGDERAKSLATTAALARKVGLVSMPDREGKMVAPKITGIGSGFYAEGFPFKSGNNVPVEMLPALMQMLEPEGPNSRATLVELLGHCEEAAASVGLARRAVFDVDADVRLFAVDRLKQRKPAEYRQTLLDALRHPWPPAADHAAEALVALADREALPALKQLLDAPSPLAPSPLSSTETTPVVRELVRVNHLSNCVLCHALSGRADAGSLIAPAPVPGSPLSPQYYQNRSRSDTILVRADVTYLRQDFSLTLPVAKAKPWPEEQRFDFLVRTRQATKEEVAAAQTPPETYPQKEAVRFAIRELEQQEAAKHAAEPLQK